MHLTRMGSRAILKASQANLIGTTLVAKTNGFLISPPGPLRVIPLAEIFAELRCWVTVTYSCMVVMPNACATVCSIAVELARSDDMA